MLIAELESGQWIFQQLHEQFIELLRTRIADEGADSMPLGTGFQIACQNRFTGRLEKLGGGLLVEDGETRHDSRFERKALQQAFAEGVDRLDLQAARNIEGAGEQSAGARERNGAGDIAGKRLDAVAESRIIERCPFAQIVEEAAGHFSSGS